MPPRIRWAPAARVSGLTGLANTWAAAQFWARSSERLPVAAKARQAAPRRGAAAGAGAEVITQGPTVNVPAESLLTFSLQQPLTLGVADTGYTRDGVHYHRISDRG